MTTLALDRPVVRVISLNVLLCAAVVAIPSLSHATAFPLYKFEPMRLLLFGAILWSSRRNALVMALWLPLLSMLTSGHPVFPKVVLIQGELVLNVLVFYALARGSERFLLAASVSVVASKALYYGAKYVLIRTALLGGDLVATPPVYQLVTFSFILLAGALVCRWREIKKVL
ncbi:MAG: hypothetical protein GY838_15105 [bacterium]|nr:hypothetical protein [bacterium]